MTYPNPEVIYEIERDFVPLKMIWGQDTQIIHRYRAFWTPTVILLNWRGEEQWRNEGFLPADEYNVMLGLGYSRHDFYSAQYDDAVKRLQDVVNNNPMSKQAPEAAYWLAVARYLKTDSGEELMDGWQKLKQRYPDSFWAMKVPS